MKKKSNKKKLKAKKNLDTYATVTGHSSGKALIGFIALVLGKSMLQSEGFNVSCKINGEEIESIKSLDEKSILQKLNEAVKDERYEDASKLKKILDQKNYSPSLDINDQIRL